jgi:hypothetical protein
VSPQGLPIIEWRVVVQVALTMMGPPFPLSSSSFLLEDTHHHRLLQPGFAPGFF